MPMNFKGDTLLHYACAKGDEKLVKFLLSDPNIIRTRKNKFDITPESMIRDIDDTNLEKIKKIRAHFA